MTFFEMTIFSITFINVSAGILFVGPDAPVPNSMFILFLSILYLFFASIIDS